MGKVQLDRLAHSPVVGGFMGRTPFIVITTFVQWIVTVWQRRTRGYAEIDVGNYRLKLEDARDRQMPMHLTRYEFRAMQETVNRAEHYMGDEDA